VFAYDSHLQSPNSPQSVESLLWELYLVVLRLLPVEVSLKLRRPWVRESPRPFCFQLAYLAEGRGHSIACGLLALWFNLSVGRRKFAVLSVYMRGVHNSDRRRNP